MNFLKISKMKAASGRGSVMVIAALLLSSASLRLVTSATSVLAKDSQLPTAPMPSSATTPSIMKTTESPAPEHQKIRAASIPAGNRSEMSAFIKALNDRETLVIQREKQLEMRKRALSIADAEIEKRLQALSDTEQALRATLSLADAASEKDLLKLTTVYENMKPKDAAILFEEMESNFAAGFLGRMRPDMAAQILAGLSPQAAYSISVILAGRHAEVPKT